MAQYKYLIVGGGMAAAAAVRGIREIDAEGPIGLIGASVHPPYKRPPLSKALWKGDPLESIWIDLAGRGVDFSLGRKVARVLPEARQVLVEGGETVGYERLLLATGGFPRTFPWEAPRVIYFRGLTDFERLREETRRGERFVVVGGGFIGSEIAAALTMNGKKVTMLLSEQGIGVRVYGLEHALFLNGFYGGKGVEVLAGEMVSDVQERGKRLIVRTRGGLEIEADGVVAGIGILPAVELAEDAGLDVSDGIVVDELLRTSRPEILAAGDVTRFLQPALGVRMRVEHEDNANAMGKQAGRNLAGANEPYQHLPFFYSDLFELGYEAVGEIDARHEIVADWKDPHREGVVYYLDRGRVRGVLLWNVWGQVDAARRLIAEPGPFTARDLRGRLPAGK